MDENTISMPTPEDDTNILDTEIKEDKPSTLALPFGEALLCNDTYPITASEFTRFVVLIGATGCGKTTLITSIYQQFLQEQFPRDFIFAGSKTLRAFEQRAYYTRITCQQSSVQMHRTPSGSLDCILHLRVRDENDFTYKNLLLTDFSGEDYERVSTNVTTATEDFKMVRAARCIVMILDGEKLSAKKYKRAEVQKAIHMLRTFSDVNLFHPDASIIITISKYDLIYKENNKELNSFIESIPRQIETQIPELTSRLILQFVAAMPNDETQIKIGYGLMELFNLMLSSKYEKYISYELPLLKSQFNLFGRRKYCEF